MVASLDTRRHFLGFLTGSDVYDQVIFQARSGLPNSGSTDLDELLGEDVQRIRIHVTRNYFRQPYRHDPGRYDCLVNLVTDADQNPKVLDNIDRLLRGFRGRLVNPPAAVRQSTRERVARRLAGLPDVRVPRTLRLRAREPRPLAALARAEIPFPLILRHAGAHTGEIIGLIESQAAFAAAPGGERDRIATEFVDYRSPDGLYRKYRVFFFGDTAVARHLLVSESWNVHASARLGFMALHPELIEEERRLLETPDGCFPERIRAALGQVRSRMPLDFFGVDFGIAPDGALLLFEANATMNFFPVLRPDLFPHAENAVAAARAAFAALLDPEEAHLPRAAA